MNEALAQLMEANLKQVWSERNATRRMQAIEAIYTQDSVLYEVNDKMEGYAAISATVDSVLKNMPEAFIFSSIRPVVINNNIGRSIWGVGPEGQPPVTTGMDIAIFEDGKIKSLYVFLDA
jgi:hypothetical protein